MSENLLNELKSLIGESLRLDAERTEGITLDTTLESLGITSLELVEIIMTIEEEYDLHIDVDAVEARESLTTVGELLEMGKQHGLEAKGEAGDS